VSAVEPLLAIRDLSVSFATSRGIAAVLRGVSANFAPGSVTGIVGESGSGKSTLASAIFRLLPRNLAALSGAIQFGGRDLLSLSEEEMRRLRGTRLAMIHQDPMTALNPVFRIATQLVDLQRARHGSAPRRELLDRAAAMMSRVGIPDAARRLSDYPHEYSGGMRQRVMIAAALLAEPDLLIADEPTTALDATIEAQIIELMAKLRSELGGTMILISHSLGLVSELCDHVLVLYGGTIVEAGPVASLFREPLHPYTRALLACEVGETLKRGQKLRSIPGEVVDTVRLPQGCIFADRCAQATSACRTETPALRSFGAGRAAACMQL
jgi:peptide/nickel transport system ATP-binding protein